MAGLTRDEFLARIRKGLGRGARLVAPPAPPVPDESIFRADPGDTGAGDRFARAATEAGMQVQRAAANDLEDTLITLLRRVAPASAVVAASDETRPQLERVLSRLGATQYTGDRDGLYDVDVALTDVACAVAETGTLVYRSSPNHGRGDFLVPPVHVAVVRESQIVSDLMDLGAGPAPIPAGEVWITGPSKTADIEGILVTGVHGPRVVHVVVVA